MQLTKQQKLRFLEWLEDEYSDFIDQAKREYRDFLK